MKALFWPLVLVAVGFLLGKSPLLISDQPLPELRVVAGAAPDFNTFQLQGAGSCAAAACHNGNRQPGTKGSEYSTWILHDKHARAYEVLFHKHSKQIQKNLLGLPSLDKAHPEKNRLCLDCHVHPGWQTAPKRETVHPQDGVSCETCHGPAEKWLTLHSRKDWEKLEIGDKVKLGMRNTKSLTGRAGVCVDCHVGNSASEVNHDLIAAGHPPLKFEFGAYHANMPHHWDDRKDKEAKTGSKDGRQAGPDFEVRAWAVGQMVTAEAALKLLARRANKESVLWPEFAEYDCFACHHSLQPNGWRQENYLKRGRQPPAGSLPWGTWYFSMPRVLGDFHNAKGLILSLDKLDREMVKPFPPNDKAALEVRAAEKELGLLLDRLRRSEPIGTKEIAKLFSFLARDGDAIAGAGWDGASQLWLGLAATHHAWKDSGKPPPPPPLAPTLKELAKVLRFPKGLGSPGADFTPKAFRQRLDALQNELNETNGSRKQKVPDAPGSLRKSRTGKIKQEEGRMFLGVDSCAGCHTKYSKGEFNKDFVQMTEWDTWQNEDKHSQAFTVLQGKLAKKMEKILGYKNPVHKEDDCLNCHALNVPAENRERNFRLEKGVTCEACHGPADKWLTPHQKHSWRLKTGKEKEDLWMVDVRNPRRQAKGCLDCHVGNATQGRILTHEMLAAGHPPLPGFELTAFHKFMPRHWWLAKEVPFLKTQRDSKNSEELKKKIQDLYPFASAEFGQTRLLVLSQIAVFEASMELLSATASTAKPKAGTLDLAVFACSSCHHELNRQHPEAGNHLGRPRPPAWPGMLMPLAIRHSTGADQQAYANLSKEYAEQIQLLHEAFGNRPFGEPAQVAAAAEKLAKWAERIHNQTAKQTWDRPSAQRLLDELALLSQKKNLDYDCARQIAWAYKTIQAEAFPQESKRHVTIWQTLDERLRLQIRPGKYLVEDHLPEALERMNHFDPAAFAKMFRGFSNVHR
jgi:hypothetical protein